MIRIQKLVGRNVKIPKLELMLSRYKQRPRDFIFLIDQFSFSDSLAKHQMRQAIK